MSIEAGNEQTGTQIVPDNAMATALHAQAPTSLSTRRALMLGAVGASAVLTIRPALAQTVGSVLNCQIPVPDPRNASQYIAADGSLVAPYTPGSFPPARNPFRGADVKHSLSGASLPGTSYEQSQAYMNYIRRLQTGQSGFTCFASIQMPGR